MAFRDQPALHVALHEGDGAQPLDAAERFATISALLERGYSVSRSAAERPIANDRTPLLVIGRFEKSDASFQPQGDAGFQPAMGERSTTALPASQRSPGQAGILPHIADISGLAPAQVADLVETERAQLAAARHGEWKPWFPVIDYDRCTNCMQCLSFCLFGVYGVDGEKRIQVQNNDNCKTNCPACSRVCPEAAIMFPKYKAGPINGDLVSDADLQKEKMKVDISALLGGDVYAMLRLRSEKAKSRFSKERDSDKALAERQKCLVKLAAANSGADGFDIPPEVLMSLPAPEEIARRASEAAAKAEAALAAQRAD